MGYEDDDGDFLMGGGGTSAKFDVGTVVRGTVLSKRMAQQTDFKSRAPLFWQDGTKRMQLVVALQTDERDDEIEDDDGIRNVYIKFKMKEAVAEAVKKAGAKRIEIGGELAIKCTGQEKPKTRGEQGTKLYKAKYTPPAPGDFGGDEEFLGDDEPAAAPAKAAKKAGGKKTKAAKGDDSDEGF